MRFRTWGRRSDRAPSVDWRPCAWASLVSWFRLLHRPDRSRKTALCSWMKFCTTSALTDASRTYSVSVRNPAVLALWRTMSYCRALYLTVTARLFFCTLLALGRPPLFFLSISLSLLSIKLLRSGCRKHILPFRLSAAGIIKSHIRIFTHSRINV